MRVRPRGSNPDSIITAPFPYRAGTMQRKGTRHGEVRKKRKIERARKGRVTQNTHTHNTHTHKTHTHSTQAHSTHTHSTLKNGKSNKKFIYTSSKKIANMGIIMKELQMGNIKEKGK